MYIYVCMYTHIIIIVVMIRFFFFKSLIPNWHLFIVTGQYGVNLKHQEYFADSPSTGMDPSTREE